MPREIDRLIEQRLVRNDPRALDAATGGEDHLRPAVIDAGCELLCGKAAEYDRMDGADARAGEHGEHRFRDHRHVDDDAIAFFHAELVQHGASSCTSDMRMGEGLHCFGDGRIVDQRRLVVSAGENVTIKRIVASVACAADEPAAVDAGRRIEIFFGFRTSRCRPPPLPRTSGLRCQRAPDLVVTAAAGVHRHSSGGYCVATRARKQAVARD